MKRHDMTTYDYFLAQSLRGARRKLKRLHCSLEVASALPHFACRLFDP